MTWSVGNPSSKKSPILKNPAGTSRPSASASSAHTQATPTPSSPSTKAPPDPPGTPARKLLEEQAERLENMAGACFLYSAMDGLFGAAFDKYAYRIFLDTMVARMAPADPIERMLVEQLVLAHHVFGRVTAKAANSSQPEVGQVYHAAAARLMAEFRMSALALKSYRGDCDPERHCRSGTRAEDRRRS